MLPWLQVIHTVRYPSMFTAITGTQLGLPRTETITRTAWYGASDGLETKIGNRQMIDQLMMMMMIYHRN